MASRVIYLEVDDEITSAASRIRSTEASRVAVVLPYGSRVATSRINFRLLSRDALTHEKRVSIVSGDPATRALAASAGLPVFSSVAEYESSLTGIDDETAAADAKAAVEAAPTKADKTARSAKARKATKATAAAAVVSTPDEPKPADRLAPASAPVGVAAPAGAPSAAGVAAGTLWGDDAPPVETTRTAVRRDPAPTGDRQIVEPAARPGGAAPSATSGATVRGGGRGRSRAPIAIGLGILALALLVAGVGTYLLLPSATIAVTPRPEPVGPIGITVVADPTVTQPDAVAGVVPANQIAVPVDVTQTFPATGKRIEEAAAAGTVRFLNFDFLRTNLIPAGSVVRTRSGTRFRTNSAVTLPRADLIDDRVFPSRVSVKVTAVEAGTEGNVEANKIVIVPNDEDALGLSVINPAATSGGTHVEFPRVVQADVDTALATLNTMLDAAFAEQVGDPALATGGATVIRETAAIGERTPSVDPATLVGQEIPTFDLGLSSNGTVTAVDAAPVAAIAETRLRAEVKPGYVLVAESIESEVGPAVVTGGVVRFEATASAEQIAVLDADALKKMVLGQPIERARSILAPYGTVELTVWPEWVGSIPTFESRVELTVEQGVQIETPTPSGSGSTP